MKHYVVRPHSGKGGLLTLAFLLMIAMGIWPVIAWFNRATLWFGLPPIVIWAYVIVCGCWWVMLIANRWLRGQLDDH